MVNIILEKNRAPTIAFTFKNLTSLNVSEKLVKNGIATRNDNFYAWRCLKALGIDTGDGVVRASLVHYNSYCSFLKSSFFALFSHYL